MYQIGPNALYIRCRSKSIETFKTIRQCLDISNYDESNPDLNEQESIDLGVDLLEKLIVFDGTKRLSAVEAMKHEFFDDYFDESDLPEPSLITWECLASKNYENTTRISR